MRLLLIIFVLASCTATAQNGTVRTDTVKSGYYLPLDSNVVSCEVGILPHGGKLETFDTQGNTLPAEAISKIGVLKKGSVIVYTDITVLNKGILMKSKPVRYVVGNRNSVPALRDPSLPDTLAASEIAAIILEKEVYSFHISYVVDGAMYDFEMTGNGVAPTVKEKILALPSGTRVWFEGMKAEDANGNKRVLPSRVYVVK